MSILKSSFLAMLFMAFAYIAYAGSISYSDYGLVFFYESTCPYCAEEEPILQRYVNKHKMAVQSVEITQQPYTAARFGVTQVPSIIVVSKKTKQWVKVTDGLVTAEQLKNDIERGMIYLQNDPDMPAKQASVNGFADIF